MPILFSIHVLDLCLMKAGRLRCSLFCTQETGHVKPLKLVREPNQVQTSNLVLPTFQSQRLVISMGPWVWVKIDPNYWMVKTC
jgi:hypothetical protein